MKKSLLFCLTLALSANGIQAQTTTFKSGNIEYAITSANTVEVAGAEGKDGAGNPIESLNIPEKVSNGGKEYTVTAIGEDALYWSDFKAITLPESIDSIKKAAFRGSENLQSIALPKGVKYIGDYAFGSVPLAEITLPEELEYLGNSAFFTASKLKSVKFGNKLKAIGTSVFYKCPIESVVLPESLDSVADKVFLNCDKLSSVTLSPKTRYLGDGVFNGCKSLSSINLPATLKHIGEECFLQCTFLTKIDLPASLEELGAAAFAQTSVKQFTVAEGNTHFTVDGNVLYSSDKRMLYAVPMTGITEVNVDKSCIGINGGAFWGSMVRNVTLPEGILAIDDYAFCQSSLESINFPSSLTYIGEQGFADTDLSGDLVLPENMPYIYDGAFAGNAGLTSITIPSAVKMIYYHAFNNCTGIKKFVCLGSTAPTIDDVYEPYDSPFYGIETSVPVYVPKGSAESYESAGWGDFLTITESDKGSLTPVKTTPESGSAVDAGYHPMSFDITFDQDITVAEANPDVTMRVGSELSGNIISPDAGWIATTNKSNVLTVWGADYDSYTQDYKAEAGNKYYVVIPAGVVKNAAGEVNDRIVIELVCNEATSIANPTAGANATVTMRFNANGQRLNSRQKGLNIERMSDGTMRKVLVK